LFVLVSLFLSMMALHVMKEVDVDIVLMANDVNGKEMMDVDLGHHFQVFVNPPRSFYNWWWQ